MEKTLDDIRLRQISACDQLDKAHSENKGLCHRSNASQKRIMANKKQTEAVEEELAGKKERLREVEKKVRGVCRTPTPSGWWAPLHAALCSNSFAGHNYILYCEGNLYNIYSTILHVDML